MSNDIFFCVIIDLERKSIMIYERLSPTKKKFMNLLGINSDSDFPMEFFDVIKSTRDDISESEKFCVDDYRKCYCHNERIDFNRLVGTDHDRYAGKSWIEAFFDLDRGDENIELFFQNPDYYNNESEDEIDMGVIEKDGKYYINSTCGGGNNRLIIMKLLYLAQSRNNKPSFSPLVRVRTVPTKSTADNIFNCEFPNGGFETSGLEVIKKDIRVSDEIYDILKDNEIIIENVEGAEILNRISNRIR